MKHHIEIHQPTGSEKTFYFRVVIPNLGSLTSSRFASYSACNTALQWFKENCHLVQSWNFEYAASAETSIGKLLAPVMALKKIRNGHPTSVAPTVRASFSFKREDADMRLMHLRHYLLENIDSMALYRVGLDDHQL